MNGNVGIGTWSPVGALEVKIVNGAPSKIVNLTGSFADLAGTRTGLYADVTAPVVGAGLATGSWSQVRTTANAGTYTSAISGAYNESLHSGNATVDYLIGALTLANQTGSGPVTNAYGLYPQVWKGAGTITNAYGLYYEGVPNANGDTLDVSGTVVNQYGLAFKYLTQGTTRNIGILLDDVTDGPSIAGNFGIYEEAGYPNYLAGNVGVGTWQPLGHLSVFSSGTTRTDNTSSDITGAFANESRYYVGQAGQVRVTPSDVQNFRFFAGSGAFQEVVQIKVNTPAMDGAAVLGAVDFYTQDLSGLVNRMSITNTGVIVPQKIGIGTSNPVGALAVMSGNVGIGTWSPTTQLQVIGNVSVTDEVYGGSWDGSTHVPTKNAVYDQVQSLIVGGAGGWTDGGTNVYTSTTTDSVAIGTTTPASRLTLAGNMSLGTTLPYRTIAAPTDGMTVEGNIGIGTWKPARKVQIIGQADVGDNFGANYPQIEHTNSGDYMPGLSVIRNVGGDTIAPIHSGASVYNGGAPYFGNQIYSFVGLTNRVSSSMWAGAPIALSQGQYLAGIGFAGQTDGNPSSGMVMGASILGFIDGNVSAGVLPSALVFNTTSTNAAALSEKMRISSTGNVGIGTSTPVGALTVMNGNVGIGTWSPRAKLEVVGSVLATSFVGDGSGLTNLPGGSTGWSDGGTNVYTSTTTDNVAIGTSTPASRLTLAGNMSLGTTLPYRTIAAQTDGMTVEGNVGIGTWAPTAKFMVTDLSGNNNYGSIIQHTGILGNFSRGLYVVQNNPGSASIGILGEVTGSGSSGVYGLASSQAGSDAIGVFGLSSGSSGTGVYAQANYNPNNTAYALKVENYSPVGWSLYSLGTSPSYFTGNVGIGTFKPVGQLTVNGSVGIGTANSTFITTAPPAGGMIVQGNVGVGTITPVGALAVMNGNVGIGTWSPGGQLILAQGNLGIGINAPAALLHVNTSVTANLAQLTSGVSGAIHLALENTGSNGGSWYIGSSNDNFSVGGGGKFYLSPSSTTSFSRFTVLQSGNVGIGTNDPVAGLSVMNGNVGIGTWSPTSRLQVIGTVNATAFVGDGSGLTNLPGGTSGWTDGGTNVYTSTTTDNVAIGTTTPAARLHVQAVSGLAAYMRTNSGNDMSFFAVDDTPGYEYRFNVGEGRVRSVLFYDSPNGWNAAQIEVTKTAGSNNNGTMTLKTTGHAIPQLHLDQVGNVGIATNTPASTLTVRGGVGIGTMLPYRTIAAPANGMIVEGNVGIGTWAADNGKLIVMNGNVGIGTVAPRGALTVLGGYVGVGTTNPQGHLEVFDASGNDTSVVIKSTLNKSNLYLYSAGTYQWQITNLLGTFAIIETGFGAQKYIEFEPGLTGQSTPIFIKSSSSVGIGTSTPVGGLAVMNGNAGIGTWSPRAKLEVVGSVLATSFYGDGSGLTNISGANSGWSDGGTNVYTTATTDNVGIGTTTPNAATLEIVKNAAQPPLKISSTASGSGDLFIISSAGNVGIGTDMTSAEAKLTVIGGNVGVGTSVPSGTLSVRTSQTSTGFNVANNAGLDIFRVSTSSNYGSVQLYDDSNNLRSALYSWGSQGPNLYSAPVNSKLDGAVDYYGAGLAIVIPNGLGNENGIFMGDGTGFSTAVGAAITFYDVDSGDYSRGGLKFKTSVTGTLSTRMTIDPNGNIGMGTFAPRGGLIIANGNVGVGTLDPLGGLVVMNGNAGIGTWSPTQRLQVIGTVDATYFVGDGSGLTNVTGANSGWSDGGANVYTTATTDNVGIGTTTPSATLEIVKTAAGTAPLMVSSTATGDGNLLIITSSGNTGIGTTTPVGAFTVMNGNVGIGTWSPTSIFEVAGSGDASFSTNVGIGTIAPAYSLEVVGTGRFSSAVNTPKISNLTTNGFVKTSGGDGTLSVDTATYITASMNAGYIQQATSSTAIGDSALFQSGSNIGIGTTSPTVALLNVNGETYIAGQVGIGTFTPTGMLDVRQDEVRIWTGAGTSTNATAAGELYVEGDLEVDGTIYGDGSGITALPSTLPAGGWTDGGTNVYASTTTDNVGIGTTTPTATLLVENAGTQASFRVNDSAVDSSPFIIDAAGNVGIGTSTAGALLAVGSTNQFLLNSSGAITALTGLSGLISSGSVDLSGGSVAPYRMTISNDCNSCAGSYAGQSIVVGGTGGTTGVFKGLDINVDNAQATGTAYGLFVTTTTPTNNYAAVFMGGRVGVGTATPGSKLTVNGNVGIGTTLPYLTIAAPANGMVVEGNVGIGTFAANSGKLIVMGGNVGVGTLTPVGALTVMSGNVGIGTWSPVRLLSVNGNAQFGTNTSSATASPLNVSFGGTYGNNLPGTVGNLKWDMYNDGASSRYGIGMSTNLMEYQAGANGGHAFYVNQGTHVFRITELGNIGVGTSDPTGKLDVRGDEVRIWTGAGTSTNATAAGELYVEGDLEVDGTIYGDGSGITALPSTLPAGGWTDGGTNVYTSTTTDNVGIGTTTPTAALLVENAGTQDSFRVNDTVLDGSPFIIDPAGNVGLGTTIPGALLDVQGDVRLGKISSPGRINFARSSDGLYQAYLGYYAGNGDMVLGSNGGGAGVQFWTGQGTEKMRISDAGNVGIGTVNTASRLAVNGGVAIGTLSTSNFITTSAPQGGLIVENNVGIGTTTPVGALAVMNGNVGIGTWSPRASLQVNNAINFTSEYDNGNSGASPTVNWSLGNKQKITLNNNATFTFTGPGGVSNLLLRIVQDGTGGRTAAWPASVKWPSGSAPTLSAAASAEDIITCYYAGTNYYCTATFNFQ